MEEGHQKSIEKRTKAYMGGGGGDYIRSILTAYIHLLRL